MGLIITVITFLVVIIAIVFIYNHSGNTSSKATNISKTYNLIQQQSEFETEILRILFEQESFMTLIIEFNGDFVQYLFDNKDSEFGIFCECRSDHFKNPNQIKDPNFKYLNKLGFSLNNIHMETFNYNKDYLINSKNDKKELLDELYLIMKNVYHIPKSVPIKLTYF
ncbi:hypothetical protein [uncultured Nonlabens sp.]|uniref:hypothetical protein n=1 Tax=uncultured Nonlabens sp. TaxID=859306 RepID=UPI00260DABF6|nr:hypothetical protein [uncultured Nonlabens sp.]